MTKRRFAWWLAKFRKFAYSEDRPSFSFDQAMELWQAVVAGQAQSPRQSERTVEQQALMIQALIDRKDDLKRQMLAKGFKPKGKDPDLAYFQRGEVVGGGK